MVINRDIVLFSEILRLDCYLVAYMQFRFAVGRSSSLPFAEGVGRRAYAVVSINKPRLARGPNRDEVQPTGFNVVVPSAAKTALERFGARALIHSGRAVRTRHHRN
jgi:hypothetical protein